MPLRRILSEFADVVRDVEVVQYDVAGTNSRLKLRLSLRDGSQLFAREIVLDGRRVKYAFHWQDPEGRLLVRWDNAEHWPEVETAPHHKHVGDERTVAASDAIGLMEVLALIRKGSGQGRSP